MTKTLQKVDNKPEPLIQLKEQAAARYDVYGFHEDLQLLLDHLRTNKLIKSKAQLFRELDYTVSKFYRLSTKFSDNLRAQDYLKKIEEIIEARLIEHGLEAKNPAFVIFMLKNHYGYQDKREVAQETTHTFKVQRGLELPKGRPRKVVDLTPKD